MEVSKIRAGKANISTNDGVSVDIWLQSPINQVANINTQDAKTITYYGEKYAIQ